VIRDSAVLVDHVSKRYRLYHERNQSLKAAVMRGGRARYDEFWALSDVSFQIETGSTFGLIGENGSGKSTLLKCLAKILRPDRGTVRTSGKVAALLELGSGFHQELSGRENIYLNGSILGLSKRELNARFDEIVGFAGLEQFIDQPVKNYSSGMYVRLGFSIAINVDPDILLLDEILAVGDASFQRKCQEKFLDFKEAGKTIVVVSHDPGSMRSICDEVAWLEEGRLVKVGRPDLVVDQYIDTGHEDRETDAKGGTRWGSGEVRLDSVAVLDADGRPLRQPSTGDDVRLRFEFTAAEPIRKPVFGVAIETLEGVYLWALHSRDAGLLVDQIDGAGVIDLRIPRLMLQPGTYDLSASIVDWTTQHVYDYRRHFLRFDVEHGKPRESGGYIALDGQWEAPRTAAPRRVASTSAAPVRRSA
jgi:ABC-type polysaccharide/polyol phosphate transport system ATPase subunit